MLTRGLCRNRWKRLCCVGERSGCRSAVEEVAGVDPSILRYKTIAFSTDTGINFDDRGVSARVRISFCSDIRRVYFIR